MSKITFRADDDLVDAVEDLDASKSEVMRDALREYLERESATLDDASDDERVDALVQRELARRAPARDVNVNITIESLQGTEADVSASETTGDTTPEADQRPDEPSGERTCAQCGESLSDEHVFCPNCGEKAARRVFCECGDEVRADWAFCPHCGRRTASADALDG